MIPGRMLRLFRTRSFSSSPNVLVIANHDNAVLKPDTLASIHAASKLSSSITVLVSGDGPDLDNVASLASKVQGVSKVAVAKHPSLEHSVAENLVPFLVEFQKTNSFTHVLAPSNASSKDFVPRLGACLDVVPIPDVMEIMDESTFKRPTYAGNAICTVSTSDPIKLLTIRSANFDSAPSSDSAASVDSVPVAETKQTVEWIGEEIAKSDRPELTAARVVVSGGRGLKSADNFGMLYELADELDGAVGASRAAVDAGFISNDHQIGQTGKVVAPDLYLAVGISGAIQHLAGMKDSKVIVAINKDKDAPIFQVADYGLVADLFTAVPELTAALKK